MKVARLASLVCLVIGAQLARGQESLEIPADPSAEAQVESAYDAGAAGEEVARHPIYLDAVEVAQAPRPATPPATTLAPPVARANVPAAKQVLPTPQTVTPEMWFYSQELDRHDDPAQAIRRKAELRAAQRMQRIAAMKWFGFSNGRPQASPIPMMGTYSPAWVGNSYDPYDWSGASWPSTALIIENYEIRR
jgi:hypothetical protein